MSWSAGRWALSRESAVAWVNAYGDAWRLQDADRILALYTPEANYVERPYDQECGTYKGHAGIRHYWETHVQAQERGIQFKQLEDDLVFDAETRTAVAKWEARVTVLQRGTSWKTVSFLQIAVLRFAADGRVHHFEEWWHAKGLDGAPKGQRDPRARRPRAGPKRRKPALSGRTCSHSALFGARLGPFDRESMTLRSRSRARKTPSAPPANPAEERLATPVAQNVVSLAVGKFSIQDSGKSHDFIDWYRRSVDVSELVEESDVNGVPLLRPWGAFLWDELRRWLDFELAAIGVMPIRTPTLAHHVDTTTCQAEATLPYLEARSCTEVLLYSAMAKRWVRSWRDLPALLNQWVSAVTPEEVKRPLPLLRSREILLQEGHAAHADPSSAADFAEAVQRIYVHLCEELLAVCPRMHEMPLSVGVDEGEPAAAGKREGTTVDMGSVVGTVASGTVVIEVPVPNGGHLEDGSVDAAGAVEVASIHRLGTATAAAFKMQFQHSSGAMRTPIQTAFSFTCRALGAALSAHGDGQGLVIPPRLAPVQLVLVPLGGFGAADKLAVERSCTWCELLAAQLQLPDGVGRRPCESGPLRVLVDRAQATPGKKLRGWLRRGVPLLLCAQLADASQHSLEATVRLIARDRPGHDAGTHQSTVVEAAAAVRRELAALHDRLLEAHTAASRLGTAATDEADAGSQ